MKMFMVNKKTIKIALLFLVLLVPTISLALGIPEFPEGSNDAISTEALQAAIDAAFSFLWPIFGAFAIFMLIRAGYLYIRTKVEDANKALLWGVIGIAVALLSAVTPYIIKAILGFTT